jgi:hypothetical protein
MISELAMSVADAIASAMRAYEFPATPAIPFVAASNMFTTIPTKVERTPASEG